MNGTPFTVQLSNGTQVTYKDIVEEPFKEIVCRCAPYTLTSTFGAHVPYALYKAIEYVVQHKIPGDFVECGVWAGGSCLLAALSFRHFGDTSRKIYMYDTFKGMPEPGEKDVDWNGTPAWPTWKSLREEGKSWGDGGPLALVKATVESSGYPQGKLIYVEGLVEDTIPSVAPERISILRLDTDLYGSTLHELRHLYPRLAIGGVLIIDDYGYFRGAREAVDEYMRSTGAKLLLNRVDDSVRVAVKIE